MLLVLPLQAASSCLSAPLILGALLPPCVQTLSYMLFPLQQVNKTGKTLSCHTFYHSESKMFLLNQMIIFKKSEKVQQEVMLLQRFRLDYKGQTDKQHICTDKSDYCTCSVTAVGQLKELCHLSSCFSCKLNNV